MQHSLHNLLTAGHQEGCAIKSKVSGWQHRQSGGGGGGGGGIPISGTLHSRPAARSVAMA
ncbi:hypothetical protein JYU34_020991 [Plutella xylostella]|uniref:Uncharacterized protein n=1 Tax=Plutella xylostella TaxID=51655 RepID=A0ABQ7PSG0_PLUXY|nr:hypothetical protein JYU34_020991 [Plutella xylostella]